MTTNATATELRRCIGSAKFGIEAHEAPADRVPGPAQPEGRPRPDVQAPLEPVHERAAQGGPRPEGGRGRGGRAGARRGADQEAHQAHAQGSRAGRPARRATPDRTAPASRSSGPGRQARGLLAFGRVVGHGRAHRGTWANVGAHGRTLADPRSATGIIRETRPRAHSREARSAGSVRRHMGYPAPVGRRTLRRVARAAQHRGVGDVERRTASGERDDVIDGQVGGWVGGALVARAPVAVLATPGAEHAGAEPLPGPRAVQGVVPAAVGLRGRARCSGYQRGW